MHSPPGRVTQAAQIVAACADARRGVGGLLLLTGEAGIGKTRLAQVAADCAETVGMPLYRGYCVDSSGAPALWPWLRVGRDEPAIAHALRRAPPDTGEARFALALAVRDALAAHTGGPGAVIVLEDLHWADSASIELLRLLCAELPTLGVLVVGTARDESGSDSPWQRAVGELLRVDGVTHLPLAGLSPDAIRDWLNGDPATRRWCGLADELAESTGGNPFYLTCVVREPPPAHGRDLTVAVSSRPTLRNLLTGASRRLPAPARRTVGTAALLGERLSPALLAAATAAPITTVSDHLAAAVSAGILEFGATGLAFRHALIRDAIAADLTVAERADAHAGIAAACENTDDPILIGPAAMHWAQVEGAPAAHRCRALARRAAAAAAPLAPERAVEFAALALRCTRLLDADDVAIATDLLELARHQWSAGQVHETLATCAEALDLAARAGDATLMCDVALVPQGVGSVDVARVVEPMCRRALVVLPPTQTTRRARLLASLAVTIAESQESRLPAGTSSETADALSAQALAAARASGDTQAELEAIAARHFVLSHPFAIDERAELASRAIELGPDSATTMGALWGRLWAVDLALQLGDLPAAQTAITAIGDVARRRGSPVARWHELRLQAAVRTLTGDFDAAREIAATALRLGRRIGDQAMVGMHNAFCQNLAVVRGDPAELPEDVLDVIAAAPPLPLVRAGIPICLFLRGEIESARTAFASLRHIPRTLPVGPRWAGTVVLIGQAAAMLNDADVARDCYRAYAPTARWCDGDGGGMPFVIGSNELTLGELARAHGDPAAAGHYERAIAVDDRIGARPGAALARLGLARTSSDRDAAVARELATQAATTFAALDMPGPLAQARAVVDENDRVAPASPATATLSRREREVADLIGAASSNQEIAQQLFLSVRTVESHVRNIFIKLDVSRRAEVARWVRDQADAAIARPDRRPK